MTKYCPLCESEYQDSIENCKDDGEKLFDAPSVRVERAVSADIYAAANEIEAECIVELLLDEGMPAQIFRPAVSAIIPNLGDTQFVIAVRAHDKTNAVAAIRRAQHEGAITNTGMFL